MASPTTKVLSSFAKSSRHQIESSTPDILEAVAAVVIPFGDAVGQTTTALGPIPCNGALAQRLRSFQMHRGAFASLTFVAKTGHISSTSIPTTTGQAELPTDLPELSPPLPHNLFSVSASSDLGAAVMPPGTLWDELIRFLNLPSTASLTSYPPPASKFFATQAAGATQVVTLLADACFATEKVRPFPDNVIRRIESAPDCLKQHFVGILLRADRRRTNALAMAVRSVLITHAPADLNWSSSLFNTFSVALRQETVPPENLDLTARVVVFRRLLDNVATLAPPEYRKELRGAHSLLGDIGAHSNQINTTDALLEAASHIDARVGQNSADHSRLLSWADNAMRPGHHIDGTQTTFQVDAHPQGQILLTTLKHQEPVDSLLQAAMVRCFPGRYTSLTPSVTRAAPVSAVHGESDDSIIIDEDTDLFKIAHLSKGYWEWQKKKRTPNYPRSPQDVVLRHQYKHREDLKEQLWREWKRRKLAEDAALATLAHHRNKKGEKQKQPASKARDHEASQGNFHKKPRTGKADKGSLSQDDVRAIVDSKLAEATAAHKAELDAQRLEVKRLKALLKKKADKADGEATQIGAVEETADDVARLSGELNNLLVLAVSHGDLYDNEGAINATELALCIMCNTFTPKSKLLRHIVPTSAQSYYTCLVCGHCVLGSHLVPQRMDSDTILTVCAQLRNQVALLKSSRGEPWAHDQDAPANNSVALAAADSAENPTALVEACGCPCGDTTPSAMDDDGDLDAVSGLEGIDLDGSLPDNEQPIQFGSFAPGE